MSTIPFAVILSSHQASLNHMSRSYQSPPLFNLDSKHYVKLSVPTSDTTVVAKSVYHTLHPPSQRWVSKFSLVHMLSELFSRMATIQGLRRGVGGAGEGVWFITLLLPRFSVEAVGVVHSLFVDGGLASRVFESAERCYIVQVGIKGRISKGCHNSTGDSCGGELGHGRALWSWETARGI
jgi:hypothetical protein